LCSLTSERRSVDNFGVFKHSKFLTHFERVFVHRVGIFINLVPLVDAQHDGASLLRGALSQDEILLTCSFGGVDD